MRISMEMHGAEEMVAEIQRLGKAAAGDALRPVVLEAGEVLAEGMRSRVRVKSGKLRDSLKATPSKDSKRGQLVARIGPGRGQGRHARALEFGYVRRNKRTGGISHIPAYPFARPAADSTRSQSDEVVQTRSREVLLGALGR